MLAARRHVSRAPPRWASGRVRLRSLQLARSFSSTPDEPKDDRGFSFGSSTAAPGPRAGEPRPQSPPHPKVGATFPWMVKALWRATKELGDTLSQTQAIRLPQSTFLQRRSAEVMGEDAPGIFLSHNNKRLAAMKKWADPDALFWRLLPRIAPYVKVKDKYRLEDRSVIDDPVVKPWEALRKTRERLLFLRRNWPAIPEDIKHTVRWDDYVFPGGRVDMFQYQNFDPNTLLWTDVISMMVKPPTAQSNAINKTELMTELFGVGYEQQFDEPEKGGPAEDTTMTSGPLAPFNFDQFIPLYEPIERDQARRERATQNIDRDIARKRKRQEVAMQQWAKERDDFFQEESAKSGLTLDQVKDQWLKAVTKNGTFWAEYFNAPLPKEGKQIFEGRWMESPERATDDAKYRQRVAAAERLDKTFVADDINITLEPDPPIKPYSPDPPDVVEKFVAELREEMSKKGREYPDPFAKNWLEEVQKRHKILKELKAEKQAIKQQVLNSGHIDGYVQLETMDRTFGGTLEMVMTTAEMMRIEKEKRHPGVFGRALSWLLNSPYRLPTASFPRETWIPPFEQDPTRYTLRAYPDPFEISTWRFRRTETGFLGRIADWFSVRNNGRQWWWMPGDQPKIRRFELWWQEYKEADDFWEKVAPHVLKTSWFRRYVMEYVTGAEWRTRKDIRNLEEYALNQQEYAFNALQHLYPRQRLDFESYRRIVRGDYTKDIEMTKPMEDSDGNEFRWGPSNEFREATVDPDTGSVTSPGWLLSTSGTRKMTVHEALEVLGYSAELKAGILPPLDAVKARAVQLDTANQTESSKVATGWRRVLRELLRDPLLEPKILEMHEVALKAKVVSHSGKSPYLGGKANAAYLAIERAHRGEILNDEDELFMKLVRENLAAEATKANEQAEGGKPAAEGAAAAGAEGVADKPAARDQKKPEEPKEEKKDETK